MTYKQRVLLILLFAFILLWMFGAAYVEIQSGYCSYDDVLRGCE